MLAELHIENFAIIERIDLQLEAGLIIFTGETGAGKSILIDAVETLLGGRAEATMIRSGADQASIEGVFSLSENVRNALLPVLQREELLDEPDQLILAREIRTNGRNLARVNGHTVSASLLREIGEHLIDVHGQSEHLSLLHVRQHLSLLDSYANVGTLLSAYRKTYNTLLEVRRDLTELRHAEREAARRIDTLTYQLTEIEAAHLRPGEDQELTDERNRLANAEGLATLAQEALLALDEGTSETPSATDLVGQIVHALHSLSRLDTSQTPLKDQAESVFENLSDLSRVLRNYLENIEFNPKRLDQVEERLALIHNLKRKYGDSISGVLAYADNAQTEIETITNAAERIQELEADESNLLEELGKLGIALSQKRHQQAGKLAGVVENELEDLQMSQTQFKVDFQVRSDPQGVPSADGVRLAFDSTGLDQVEFLIAPNPGEGLKPLAKIASGGETSRLMLALKNVLAREDQIPTLIFDEIDQGIGGRVGQVVGNKLWSLAHRHQVLCVTHLPQLAAFGDQHYQVEKYLDGGRTITRVSRLTGDKRLTELAQMYGEISQGTLQSAREILQAVENRTHGS
ncbi:MAG: DNA repair protein RecN [Chloroflexi bacterium RBG_16_52_11]|nr:MAG: DNA repair protein RecN [Chloroflexi bacterium RBG_16_52_11]